ncbi:helix-turn-helix domain-containing protein [Actinocatenispora rupis]|uniref:Transcriptional regulator n=1 Tax=Actinocatenispora rupis TaxID=519421 RepID=A0A8J3N9W9_9ACTN|nr:helix-turn-helix transcriptional regulator [Actinocatenispora rupis]GID11764.1 transcriptional regulator [Actinocatenispora rupis]
MSTRTSPTVKRRRIASELRRLRAGTGMSAEEAGRRVGLSKSAISRIENAESTGQVATVAALMRLYGVADEDVEQIEVIARQARTRGWWQRWNDVLPAWFDTYVGLESEASHISEYEPQLVPGLLQTADYARSVIRAEHPDDTVEEVERRVELRLQRQHADDPPKLWIVLDEAVLHRIVGSREIMRAQLKRVLDTAQRPGNDIQVLSFEAGEHGSMGSAFFILRFPDPRDTPCVYLENRAGSLYLEEVDEVQQYTTLFDHLRATALGVRRSEEMISEAINRL